MTNPNFTESNLRSLLEAIQSRAITFAAQLKSEKPNQLRNLGPDGNVGYSRPIYLRFDIDDDPSKAYRMSFILNEYGINGTFFVLNTAKYWNMDVFLNSRESLFEVLRQMQSKGHEIGWHNNALAQFASLHQPAKWYNGWITEPLQLLRAHDLRITGSASHGDPLCRKLGFINYEIFEECERTSEAEGFPPPSFDWPRLKMADFGLEYEAYHVPYDIYLSESGGRSWTLRRTSEKAVVWDGQYQLERLLKEHDRIQILIHPQHWQI